MIIVVSGKAMMRPMKPNSAPHTESDSSRIAGLSPMALPMMRGTRMVSVITWTMAKTASAPNRMAQKLSPVSAAFSSDRKTMGFIENWIRKNGSSPPDVRNSWEPVKKLLMVSKNTRITDW